MEWNSYYELMNIKEKPNVWCLAVCKTWENMLDRKCNGLVCVNTITYILNIHFKKNKGISFSVTQ